MTGFGTVTGPGTPGAPGTAAPVMTGSDPESVAGAVNSGQVGNDTPGLQTFSDSWSILVDLVNRYAPERSAGFAGIGALGN